MLKGIFSPNDESQCPVNDGSKSPRTIAIDQLQVETGYIETWSVLNQQYIINTQQIAALKQQHKTESFDLDQDASDELWETSFLPKVKALGEAQTLLEETRKKLETEKIKVYQSINIIEIKGY
jgi:hypothetical protein